MYNTRAEGMEIALKGGRPEPSGSGGDVRIRTRLFVMMALLVGALLGVQWWLQMSQMRALEAELARVAAQVGQSLVGGGMQTRTLLPGTAAVYVNRTSPSSPLSGSGVSQGQTAHAGKSVGPAGKKEEHKEKADAEKIPETLILNLPGPSGAESGESSAAKPQEESRGQKPGEAVPAGTPSGVTKVWAGDMPPDALLKVINETRARRASSQDGGKMPKATVHVYRNGVEIPPAADGKAAVALEDLAVGGRHEEQAVASSSGTSAKSSQKLQFTVQTKMLDSSGGRKVGAQDVKTEVVTTRTLRVDLRPGKEGKVLYLSVDGSPEKDVQIPLTGLNSLVSGNLRNGMIAGAVLLGLGLLGAAAVAHSVTRPLRRLSEGVEALGRGDLGAQVEARAGGEVGELERTFNRISLRLAELEAEKKRWEEKAHLVELGGLAHGLAHTLRNPLHTLGLAVDELANRSGEEGADLAEASRAQIRRVDRWLRSFLALGAGDAAEPEDADLGAIVQDLVLEAVQSGARIELNGCGERHPARVVVPALRAALANLLDNAVEASPAGTTVSVTVGSEEGAVRVNILDRGAGLPEEVRARLGAPHVTTKPGGSGMGLYLARQLVEGAHGGTLHFSDAPGGGTEVVVRIPSSKSDTGEHA